jgi:hypothetical protein
MSPIAELNKPSTPLTPTNTNIKEYGAIGSTPPRPQGSKSQPALNPPTTHSPSTPAQLSPRTPSSTFSEVNNVVATLDEDVFQRAKLQMTTPSSEEKVNRAVIGHESAMEEGIYAIAGVHVGHDGKKVRLSAEEERMVAEAAFVFGMSGLR